MNDDVFCALYDAHARRLWAYAARATGDAAAADDIVQETFLRVFAVAHLDAADADHRRRYLYTVATNLVRRRYRAQAADVPLSEAHEPSATTAADDTLIVRQVLGELSTSERQALWLAHVEGWSHREIARLLGYREGSVRQLAVRARRRFREMFTASREARHVRPRPVGLRRDKDQT